MNLASEKKPRRVNIAALLNILVGVVSFSAIILLAGDPDVASRIQIDSSRVWIGSIFAGALILSSIWALLGRRNSHFIMLGVAILYYGALIYQNASFLGQADVLFNEQGESRLWGNIVRTTLELALTAWAVLSSKTRSYFAARYNAP